MYSISDEGGVGSVMFMVYWSGIAGTKPSSDTNVRNKLELSALKGVQFYLFFPYLSMHVCHCLCVSVNFLTWLQGKIYIVGFFFFTSVLK